MTRIVYGIYSSGGMQGGHKMILRHVEALRDLGFEAVAYTGEQNRIPTWFETRAPVLRGQAVDPQTDIFVVPDDVPKAITQLAGVPMRKVLFVQNHFSFASTSLAAMGAFPEPPPFLAISPTIQRILGRLYPSADVHLVRSFADERLFRPAERRERAVAVVPRKRPTEAQAIQNLFRKLHPEHADAEWRSLEEVTEAQVAEAFSTAEAALSLNHLEGLGMTTLEAMASGCLAAGFTGIGGLDYATPDNGFWVAEDDDLAAADALAQAMDVARTGGAELKRRREAGLATARRFSYAAFLGELEAAWMALAPEARVTSGPLDGAP